MIVHAALTSVDIPQFVVFAVVVVVVAASGKFSTAPFAIKVTDAVTFKTTCLLFQAPCFFDVSKVIGYP